MKKIYSRDEVAEIAKKLGFKSFESFSGFLVTDFDMFETQGKGIEENSLYLKEEKEKVQKKMEELKLKFGFNLSLPPEELILKVIEIVKEYNKEYLLNRFNGKIDEETAEKLVEYAYTHGNCGSLVNTIFGIVPKCSVKMFRGGRYGHRCLQYNGNIYDITGCSTVEEMKQFVTTEGNVPYETATVEDIQNAGQQRLIDYIVTENIKVDKAKKREQEAKKKEEELKTQALEFFIGRRCEKTSENSFGWEDKIPLAEIDTSEPIVICLPGSGTTHAIAANGMCKSIEKMLGISELSDEDKPCQIYGAYYDVSIKGYQTKKYFDQKANGENPKIEDFPLKSQPSIRGMEKFAQDLVEAIFKPAVQDEDDNLREPMEIARRFRNIHFVSFCFGSVVQSAVNIELRQFLQSTGLDLNTIEKLESQICVLQTAPFACETKTNQTTINFVSIADSEVEVNPVESKAIEDFESLENKEIIGGVTTSPENNPTVYVKEFTTRERDDEHYGDYYLHLLNDWESGRQSASYEEKVGGVLPLCTAICLRRAMQNAVSNAHASKFVPLSANDVVKPCVKYVKWANFHPQEIPVSLLEIYNKHVDYANTNLIDSLGR